MQQAVTSGAGNDPDEAVDRTGSTADGTDLRTYLMGGGVPDLPTMGGRRLALRLRGLLGPRSRQAVKMLGTRLAAPRSARRLRELHRDGTLLLNLGSGTHNVPGWVNVDLWGWHAAWGVHPDVVWDLRRPLPLPDGSVEGISMEHVLEHLPAAVGLSAVDQCHRLLRPGGVLRLSVPDFGRYARSYAAVVTGSEEDADFLARQRPGRPTSLMAVSEVVYHHGHVSVWDAETLIALLRCAGFTDVTQRAYGETRLSPVPDSPERRGESLYVEAVKPAAGMQA